MPQESDVRATRQHAILSERHGQLARNLLVKDGGGAYINARLARFPCESDLSWSGKGTSGTTSRKERAFLINYAARIIAKINQYVFSQNITRDGIDEDFALDASRTGMSINRVMASLSAAQLAGQWSWLGIDRGRPEIDPATGTTLTRSIADREASGDRIFWTVWDSTEVVDWRFGQDGKLERVITQEVVYDNSDVNAAAVSFLVRTIWEPGGGVRLVLNSDNPEEVKSEEPFELSAPVVPFVLLGVPTIKPWWFDDVERVQASILNLDSAHHENLIGMVFPQSVLPAGLVEEVMRLSGREGAQGFNEALEICRGMEYPIFEPTDAAGLTRYLTPNASDLEAIPTEILRRRGELYGIVGLGLSKKDTAQVESAAAKAWDHLDPSAVLSDRADELEEAETKAVEISVQLDTDFQAYTPAYSRSFDLINMAEDMKTVLGLNGLDLPESALREVAHTGVDILNKVRTIPKDRLEAIHADIDNMTAADLVAMTTAAAPSRAEAFDADGEGVEVEPTTDTAKDLVTVLETLLKQREN